MTSSPQEKPQRRTSLRLAMKNSAQNQPEQRQQGQKELLEAHAAQEMQQQQHVAETQQAQHDEATEPRPECPITPARKRLRLVGTVQEQSTDQQAPKPLGDPCWASMAQEALAKEGSAPCQDERRAALVVDPAVVEDAPPQLIPQHLGGGGGAGIGVDPLPGPQAFVFLPEAMTARTPRQGSDLACGLWSLLPDEVHVCVCVCMCVCVCVRPVRQYLESCDLAHCVFPKRTHTTIVNCMQQHSLDNLCSPSKPLYLFDVHTASQLIEVILKQCSAHQLGQLESSCCYFRGNRTIERITKQRLKAVPRAKGLKPSRK
jgi:hypothetical protein